MKKFTFGTPEPLVPSRYCDGFHYEETPISFQGKRLYLPPDEPRLRARA